VLIVYYYPKEKSLLYCIAYIFFSRIVLVVYRGRGVERGIPKIRLSLPLGQTPPSELAYLS
jgi:hypothetical protein